MPRKKKPESDTSSATSASQPFSTTRYFHDSRTAVQYAKDMLTHLANVSPSIIIIEPEGSVARFVHFVTGLSSDDIQTLISCRERPITFDKTLDG